MKTTMIARCVFAGAAIFAAAGLIGCGAESGTEPQTGANHEALSVTGNTFDVVPASLEGAASCVLHDDDGTHAIKDYLLVAGGVTSASAYSRSYYVFDPTKTATNQWIASGVFGTLNTDERAYAKAIQIAGTGNAKDCLLVGGYNAAASPVATFRFSVANGTVAVNASNPGSLPAGKGRGKLQLGLCSNGNVLAVGGVNHAGTVQTQIQVWSGTWAAGSTLGVGRYDFGFIADPVSSNDRFLVAGGNDGSGPSNSIELIKKTTACGDTISTLPSGIMDTTKLSAKRTGLVLLPEGNTDKYIAAAGYTTSAVTTTDLISVNWGTPNSTTIASGPALPSAAHRPALAVRPGVVASSAFDYVLIGGDDNPTPTAAKTDVNEFIVTPNSGVQGTWYSTTANLATARTFHAAEYLGTKGMIYSTAGFKFVTGVKTDQTSTEEIAP